MRMHNAAIFRSSLVWAAQCRDLSSRHPGTCCSSLMKNQLQGGGSWFLTLRRTTCSRTVCTCSLHHSSIFSHTHVACMRIFMALLERTGRDQHFHTLHCWITPSVQPYRTSCSALTKGNRAWLNMSVSSGRRKACSTLAMVRMPCVLNGAVKEKKMGICGWKILDSLFQNLMSARVDYPNVNWNSSFSSVIFYLSLIPFLDNYTGYCATYWKNKYILRKYFFENEGHEDTSVCE